MAIKDDLPEGRYVIRNLAKTSLVLDVSSGGYANGSNIQVFTNNYTPAQTWQLRWNSDDTCYLVCECNGKCADAASETITAGGNVQSWNYYGGRNQTWIIEKGSTTATVGDKTLQSYRLKLAADTAYYMECWGSPSDITAGTNVQIYTKDTGTDQEWLFDPLDVVHDGGVYEIRTLANTSNCLDNYSGASTTNGNRVWSYARNNTNAQKWVLIKDGDNWKIRQGNSSWCLDAGSGSISSGQAAQIWSDNTSRNQRFTFEAMSTAVIDGRDLPVVRIKPVKNTGLCLDVQGNNSQSGTNVWFYTANTSTAQQWVLVPTTLTDPTMPVPNIQGLVAGSLDATDASLFRNHDDGTFYLKGTCPQSWTTKNGNSFRLRWRWRNFDHSGKWYDWVAYNAWFTPLMKQQTPNWWYTQAIEANMDGRSILQKQYQFEMQTQGVDEYQNITSSTASQTVTVTFHPTNTITGATLTPEGIRVMFDTDYSYSMTFYLSSVKYGDTEILTEAIECTTDDDNNTFDVPFEYLKDIPDNITPLHFTYTFSTDVSIKFTDPLTQSATMRYGQGNVSKSKYPLTLVEDNVAGNQQRWYFAPSGDSLAVLTTDGQLYPLTKGDDGYWLIPRFMENLKLIGLWQNASGSEWCARVDTIAASDVAFHGFTWGEEDGVIIWLNKGEILTEERNIAADAEEHTLLGRAHPYVSYTANQQNGNNYTKISATVKGYILPDRLEDYDTTPASVERMLEVGHCLYRSPKGRVANVAVTDASLTFERDVIQISVSYIEECL